MPRFEVIIAGFGGQGVVTLGYVLGQAACLFDGKYAGLCQSYGPEARGGACKSEIVISEDPIDHSNVTRPDALIAMSQEAYHKYEGCVRDAEKLFWMGRSFHLKK